MLILLLNYLHEDYQSVFLNGPTPFWELTESRLQKESVLDRLMFLEHIDDIPDNIKSSCKVFADDTFLFSHFLDKCKPHREFYNNL